MRMGCVTFLEVGPGGEAFGVGAGDSWWAWA